VKSLKLYFLGLMKDRHNNFLDSILKGILKILSWIYTVGVKAIDWSYNSGLRKRHKVSVPVVSVGNITLGGTGKTPFTIFLSEHFLVSGHKPAVLIRGYGNDESRMLKDELPDVPVLVGQDRVKNAQKAAREGRDIILLDDGFQHRRLARDLDIVLIDGSSVFGNSAVFPRGVLREPASSLARADLFVVTKADMINAEDKGKIEKQIRTFAPEKPVLWAKHRILFLTDVTGAAYAAETLKNKNVCIMSAVGDPDYFAFLVKGQGANIAIREDYPDHYNYLQVDVARIFKKVFKEGSEKIVVTRKDFVKLEKLDISSIEEKLFVLNIVMDITEGKEALLAGLDRISNDKRS